MGTTFKRGRKWGISYIAPDGQQVRKLVAPFKETAEMILKKIETEIAEGKYLDRTKEKNILFEDFAREYLNTYVRLENKHIRNQEKLINGLKKHFQGKFLSQINTLIIRQYLSKRLELVAPATVNRDFSMLRSMFNRAIEWNLFRGPNPTKGMKQIPEKNSRCRWLSDEEQELLLSHCHGITKVIVIIALKTGMRWGEIVNLKWRQNVNSNYVDFENGTIYIHESLAKTDRSRFVPLSNAVRLALREVPKHARSEYIFLNDETNKPLGSIKKSFATALEKSEIQDFKFHDLRHTFASSLAMRGVDLYVIQKLLGNTTPKMTQRYAHLRSDQLKEAIEKIDIHLNKLLYNSTFAERDSTNLAQEPEKQNGVLSRAI